MDPFTGVLMLMFVTVGAKAVLGGVTDLWAKARGETPPSLEKWRKRQEDRAARGSKPEKDPGPLRRRFRNAAERSAEKAAQKHAAKMERLRENARDNIDGYKGKYAKRAERRRRMMDKLASWAMGVKDGVKNWYDEWQAYQENEARNAEADRMLDPPPDGEATAPEEPAAAEPAAAESTPDTGDGADVIPFPSRPGDAPADPAPAEPATPEPPASTTDEGNTAMPDTDTATATNTNVEITDLPSAIAYTTQTISYADVVGPALSDILSQLETIRDGVELEVGSVETAGAAIKGLWSDGNLPAHFDTCQEALAASNPLLNTTLENLGSVIEEINKVSGEMKACRTELEDQQSITETVEAHRSSTGVFQETDAYKNA